MFRAFLFLNMFSGTVRADKHPAMQVYEKDLDLYRLVQKVEIIYDPSHHADLGVTQEKYTEVSTAMTLNIRHNLAYSMNTDVLKKVLDREAFSVHIVSPPFTQERAAAYDYAEHAIKIAWDEHFTDGQMRKILQNEMHHAVTCAKNAKKTIDCLYVPDPEELHKIIAEGCKRIAQSQIRFNSGQYKKEFEELSGKMTDYEPHVWQTTSIPKMAYQHILGNPGVKTLADGRIFIPKEAMSGAPADILKNDLYLIVVKEAGEDVALKFSFSKDSSADSKMRAFFLDMQFRRSFYEPTTGLIGGYTNDAFFKTNLASKASELASDVEMLPPALKKLFFPKFCKMFSKFHQVEKYCERPVPEIRCKA